MKSKCSFILKASLALVLALVMLFGTVATSVAAVVEDDLADTGAEAEDLADTGADVDLAETGWTVQNQGKLYFAMPYTWTSSIDSVQLVIKNTRNQNSSHNGRSYKPAPDVSFSKLTGTDLYYANMNYYNTSWGEDWEGTDKIIIANDDAWSDFNALTNLAHYTQVFTGDYNNTSNYYRVYYSSTGATNISVTTGWNSDRGNATNITQKVYVYTDTSRGGTYSNSETGGKVVVNYKQLSADSTVDSSKTFDTSSESGSDYYTVPAEITLTATANTNYEFVGWYTDASGGTALSTDSSAGRTVNGNVLKYHAITQDYKIYARFRIKPKVTLSENIAAGGAVTIGGTTVDNGGTKYVSTSTNTNVTVTAATGYTISSVSGAGWTRKSGETSTTSYTGTINTSANATLSVTYSEITGGVALTSVTNGNVGDTTGGHIEDGSGTTITSLSGIGAGTTGKAVSVKSSSSYNFLGWQISGDKATKLSYRFGTSGSWTAVPSDGAVVGASSNTTIYIKTDGSSGITTSNAIVKAHFQSSTAHYVTVYNNTLYDRQHWVVVSSPPQTVKVTNPAGTVKTYKYAAGTKEQRGEDQTTSGTPATKNIVNTNNATYYEGNLLEVHEGDKVELIYSALASSDIITGVFYNNTIRYTTEKEDDNLFARRTYRAGGYGSEGSYHDLPTGVSVPDDDVDFDYHDDTTHASASATGGYALYANQHYYNTELAEVIAAQNYTATVDQDTHTVTWTVGNQDYYNIDMELNSKKEIHFSDTVNAKIHEVHTDNYYAVGEDVSPSTTETASLSIKAAGNSTQTNTITKANIKFYYCNNMGEYINPVNGKVVSKANRVELKEGDATLTVGGSAEYIQSSGSSNSSDFYYIDGPMPATDVMVDLDISIAYSLKMYSKIQSDTVDNKTAFYQVADLTLGTKHNKNTSATTATQVGTASCVSGQNITLKAESITTGYMFVGWFLGDSSGPDLTTKALSNSETFSYKPTSSATIWAVGTRNIYITGSKALFKDTNNWVIHEMKFDATLGTKGKYYWEIDQTIFSAASSDYFTVDNGTDNDSSKRGYFINSGSTHPYWNINAEGTDNHGNAYFQFLNTNAGNYGYGNANYNKQIWHGIESFESESSKIRYGKANPRDYDNNDYALADGQGFIDFDETNYAGYSVPIRIYYDPAVPGTFTVEPTSVYPRIHVSNGYKGIDTDTPSEVQIKVNSGTARGNNSNNNDYSSDGMKFHGAGWDPHYEGHVSDIEVKARNATLTLSKTVTNTDYKVSNFLVYNMTKGTVKAHPATKSGTTYTCNTIKTSDDDRLYIVPIIEYCGSAAKITINVDSTKLDYKKWGKLVSCYAWGPSDAPCGSYPGQLMVPSDDGGSWTATFKAPSTLTGILFGNYVDASGSDGYTFISEPGIMGNVTYSGTGDSSSDKRIVTIAHSDYVTQYNKISSGDFDKYTMANCKVQTYDYREPIAYLKNKPAGASNTTLTFALKDGNSNLLSRSHAQLKDVNILTLASTSNPSTPYAWSALKWEYLTDSSGDYYTDLNGFKLPEKPTASFYIAAKGMVKYSDNSMNTVFKTGKEYDSVTGVNYNDYYGRVANEIDMNYAVQWYVYDAAGNYITDVLSAGFADKTDVGTNSTNYSTAMSVVTQRLLDLGYAVEGRSVKICYDKPRYCYWNDEGSAPYINNGDSFNVYRFTGQWYEDNEYRTAKVYAKVGIKTDNGVDVAEASSAAYGSASVEVDGSKCSIAGYSGTNTEGDVDYGYTTIIDGDSGALSLKASEQNFVGWYHYVTTYDSSDIESSDTTQELVFDTADPEYKPNYSKDVTYIAIYKAKVNYRYKYVGREGGTKYYNVPGSSDDNEDNMSADEIANGNKVATDSTHMTNATANVPGGAGISIFKKNINFNGTLTTSMFSNELEYVLTVSNSSKSDPTYTVTAQYHDGSGWQSKAVSKQYNKVINLTAENSGAYLTNQWSGHEFIGWYEYDPSTSTYGNLLSTQANYGLVCTKTQTIRAVYTGDGSGKTGPEGDDKWEVFVDDHGPTYEKTSSSAGDVYCDAIVRVRMNNSNLTTLDEGGKVGMLIVDDNGSNVPIDTSKLTNYAIALRASNGKSGNVKVGDYTLNVTNLFSTSVNSFGRVDLAAKYSYGNVTGQNYHIYAYYFKGGDATDKNNYVFSTSTGYATGTYS